MLASWDHVSNSSFPRSLADRQECCLGPLPDLQCVTEVPLHVLRSDPCLIRSKSKVGNGMTAPRGTWPWQLQMYTGNISYPRSGHFLGPIHSLLSRVALKECKHIHMWQQLYLPTHKRRADISCGWDFLGGDLPWTSG